MFVSVIALTDPSNFIWRMKDLCHCATRGAVAKNAVGIWTLLRSHAARDESSKEKMVRWRLDGR